MQLECKACHSPLRAEDVNFDLALALGLILLALVYAVNLALTWVQQRDRPL